MRKLLELYLRKPVLYDILIGGFLTGTIITFSCANVIKVPDEIVCLELISDVSNMSFTSTGFVLTILTVLITFKAGSRKRENIKEYETPLNLFFQTPLYKKTTDILKGCIKVLIFVALTSFLAKALFAVNGAFYLFFYGLLCIFVLSLTLVRCVLILGKVLGLQTVN
jgi:ABC-type multidrug transport system permease subunit